MPQPDYHWYAERIARAQSMNPVGSLELDGEPAPSPAQVAAVLRALADHTLLTRLIEDGREIGADRADMGGEWVLSTGIGRLFQRVADDVRYSGEST